MEGMETKMELPAKKGLCIAVDYYDLINVYREPFGEDRIDRLLAEYAERGVTSVQWRVSVLGKLLYRSRTGDRVTYNPAALERVPGYASARPHAPLVQAARERGNGAPFEAFTIQETFQRTGELLASFDPMEAVVRLCRKHGIRSFPWLTIYDDAGYHPFTRSSLVCNHPEYCWKSYKGGLHYLGVTSYAYPEAVEYRLAQIRELLDYGPDGIHLCIRSHSRPPGYNERYMDFLKTHSWEDPRPEAGKLPQFLAAARNQYGFDPPAVEAFRKKTGLEPHPDSSDWWRFRGTYLTDFLRQAKMLAKARGAELSFGPRYNDPMFPDHFFDWKGILDGHIADELHYAATDAFRGKDEIGNEWPEFMNSPGRKYYFFCVKAHRNSEDFKKVFEATGNAGFMNRFDGLTVFEAFHLSLNPELWNFVDYLKKQMD